MFKIPEAEILRHDKYPYIYRQIDTRYAFTFKWKTKSTLKIKLSSLTIMLVVGK